MCFSLYLTSLIYQTFDVQSGNLENLLLWYCFERHQCLYMFRCPLSLRFFHGHVNRLSYPTRHANLSSQCTVSFYIKLVPCFYLDAHSSFAPELSRHEGNANKQGMWNRIGSLEWTCQILVRLSSLWGDFDWGLRPED